MTTIPIRRGEVKRAHLVGDIRASLADIPIDLPHDADMFIAVQQGVPFIAQAASTGTGMRGGPEGL